MMTLKLMLSACFKQNEMILTLRVSSCISLLATSRNLSLSMLVLPSSFDFYWDVLNIFTSGAASLSYQ